MMTFFHTLLGKLRPNQKNRLVRMPDHERRRNTCETATTSNARRRNAQLHRLLAALCTGLAVFAALQSVHLAVATQPIVLVTKAIAKGSTITRQALTLREIPYDKALQGAFHTLDDATGAIAQVDIAQDDILMPAMARASPTVPQGYTGIEVRLASATDDMLPGDQVTLSSTATLGSGMPDMPDGSGPPPDDAGVQLRTLCPHALMTGKPTKDAQGNTVVVFAMPPTEAAAVLQAQEYSAIIATIN